MSKFLTNGRKSIGSNVSVKDVSPDVKVLYSYETPVAGIVNGQAVATATFYSMTTTRHINTWLEGMKATLVPQDFLDNLVA